MNPFVPRPKLRLPLLLAGVLLLAMATVFVSLASEVGEGETRDFDLLVLNAALAARAAVPWLAEVMRDLSGVGSTTVLALFTTAAVTHVAMFSSRGRALLVAGAVGSGAVAVLTLKAGFARVRPDLALAQFPVSGYAFPSGHATMSAVVFLTLAVLVADTRPRRRERLFIVSFALLLAILVGTSRIVLGVHFATDVLGGWVFGVAWASAWWLIDHAVASRRHP